MWFGLKSPAALAMPAVASVTTLVRFAALYVLAPVGAVCMK